MMQGPRVTRGGRLVRRCRGGGAEKSLTKKGLEGRKGYDFERNSIIEPLGEGKGELDDFWEEDRDEKGENCLKRKGELFPSGPRIRLEELFFQTVRAGSFFRREEKGVFLSERCLTTA